MLEIRRVTTYVLLETYSFLSQLAGQLALGSVNHARIKFRNVLTNIVISRQVYLIMFIQYIELWRFNQCNTYL